MFAFHGKSFKILLGWLSLEIETLDHLGHEVYFSYTSQNHAHNHDNESLHAANVTNCVVPVSTCECCIVLEGVKTQSYFNKRIAFNKFSTLFGCSNYGGGILAVTFCICVFDILAADPKSIGLSLGHINEEEFFLVSVFFHKDHKVSDIYIVIHIHELHNRSFLKESSNIFSRFALICCVSYAGVQSKFQPLKLVREVITS